MMNQQQEKQEQHLFLRFCENQKQEKQQPMYRSSSLQDVTHKEMKLISKINRKLSLLKARANPSEDQPTNSDEDVNLWLCFVTLITDVHRHFCKNKQLLTYQFVSLTLLIRCTYLPIHVVNNSTWCACHVILHTSWKLSKMSSSFEFIHAKNVIHSTLSVSLIFEIFEFCTYSNLI